MKLHYFVIENADGTFQAQESQASYGGEHDHPAEIVDGRVITYATLEEAGEAALRARNEAACAGYRAATVNTKVASVAYGHPDYHKA